MAPLSKAGAKERVGLSTGRKVPGRIHLPADVADALATGKKMPGTTIPVAPSPPVLTGAGFRVRLAHVKGLTDSKLLPYPMYFQVGSLDDWTLGSDGAHDDYETITGEFSRKGGGRKLREVTFHTMIVFADFPWLTAHGVDPFYIRNQMESLRDTRSPFELVVALATGQVEVKMDATIRHLDRVLKAGEADARYLDVDMKEYRDPIESQRRHTAAGNKKFPARHKLVATDTLVKLAKTYYRDIRGWHAIAAENGITKWGGNTPITQMRAHPVGSILKIPAWDRPKKVRDIHAKKKK